MPRLSPLIRTPARLFPRRALFHSSPLRLASAADSKPASVPIALISQIRAARPGTPLSLARTALQSTQNDLQQALAWIANQAAESGAAKAKKLEGRTANEGLVGVAVLADGTGGVGVRAAMVELRCETDFVARTDEFRDLVESVARSVAFFAEPTPSSSSTTNSLLLDRDLASLGSTPVIPPPSASATHAEDTPTSTIASSIASTISRLGENISLARVASVAIDPVLPGEQPTHLAATYLHGAKASTSGDTSFQAGTLASLLVCRLGTGGSVEKDEVRKIVRALARQVVAMPTSTVEGGEEKVEEGEQSTALYEQGLMTMSSSAAFEFEQGSKVGEVLRLWSKARGVEDGGLKVEQLKRWQVGQEE
ncbi:elongation factor TS-domain-containing protein [Leucosporidium creatinivorum]|uniref:Elongation factor Ts, mitochondrial n=1 Tax=Leucosporidium creatinivorum TaxID=106004 RepID=A0A1Y2ERT4_9BASI|nr:elongation factor TS-domain-containing protein [Leucosporidium creatinivorum]